MLAGLRNAAQGLTAKILLGLLIASFAVWGVSGAFVGRSDEVVVAAGETVVTTNAYRLAYDRSLNDLSQRLGVRLTAEQAAGLGIDRSVLGDVVTAAVLDEQARELGLGITDDELAEAVASDTAFAGAGGRFDRTRFRSVLRSVGMTEADYLAEREAVARRQQLLNAVAGDAAVPATYAAASAALEGQSRDVTFLRLGENALPPADPPTEAEIAAYFEANADRYDAPEYRTIRAVALTPATLADPASVPAEEVRAAYETDAARYTAPATADIAQLLFPDRASADDAAARLADGRATFDDLVAELGADAGAIVTRGATAATYPDRTVADAAFALGDGETSPVTEGRFGPVILRATNVRPAVARPFEEVEGTIRETIAAREAADSIYDVSDGFEDARAGGATLDEAAAAQGLEVVTIGPVDREGLGPDGAPVPPVEGVDVLAAAFDAEEGVENDALQPPGGGFVWYEVERIDPARPRTPEEARADVIDDLEAERRSERLAALARELEAELRAGTPIEALAARAGGAPQTAFAVRRAGGDGLSPGEAAAAFAGPEGHVALVPGETGGYALMRVDAVTSDAVPPSADATPVEEDILQQFVADLERRYTPTYNAALAERVRTQ